MVISTKPANSRGKFSDIYDVQMSELKQSVDGHWMANRDEMRSLGARLDAKFDKLIEKIDVLPDPINEQFESRLSDNLIAHVTPSESSPISDRQLIALTATITALILTLALGTVNYLL